MTSAYLVRWSGLVAMLAGVCWIAFALRLASLPEGCVGAECDLPGRGLRPQDGLVVALFVAAAGCTAVAVAGLLLRARTVGSLGRLGRVGLLLLGGGALLLIIGLLVQAFAYGGDFPHMPTVVIPGGLALVLGFLLVAVAVLRTGALPRWASALLLVGTLALVGFNDQNAQALLAVPFGLAWLGVGYALWSGTAPRAPVPPAGE